MIRTVCRSGMVNRLFAKDDYSVSPLGTSGHTRRAVAAAIALTTVLGGCHPGPERFPLEPLPMRDAVRIVNENTTKVAGTLRASGHVDGRFTLSDGRSGSYHLDGILFYLAPKYVRFDLKSFGDRKFLFGSNAEYYWYYDAEADTYHCGRHGSYNELSNQIPIPPDQIVDALGLAVIPIEVSQDDPTQPVQRVVADHQQILFLVRDERGHITLQKEYWLDRCWPRLLRRVVFRDADGVVEMESELGDYRALAPDGPLLPHVMSAMWPETDAWMRFRVSKWRLEESVGPDDVQFTAPPDCADR